VELKKKLSTYDVVLTRRSIRQFQSRPVPRDVLKKIANSARLAPSAANRQPLEFIAVDDFHVRAAIFPCLKWAGYIAPEGNPRPGQEPAAYVMVLANLKIRETGFSRDVGAAMENMILTAWEEGIGSCWIVSVDKDKVCEILSIPDGYMLDSVLSLGYPAESPVIEDLADSYEYWKDQSGRLHVPKRTLDSVLHFNGF